MKIPLKIRRRDRSNVAISLILLTLSALSAPNVINNSNRWASLTTAIQQEADRTEILKIKQEALTERSKIADERLKGLCNVIPVGWEDPSKAAVLSEGVRIKNPDNGAPFPPGTIACDPWGNTGIVEKAADGSTIVTHVASTTNFELVRKAMAAHGLTMEAGTPNLGASAGRAKP